MSKNKCFRFVATMLVVSVFSFGMAAFGQTTSPSADPKVAQLISDLQTKQAASEQKATTLNSMILGFGIYGLIQFFATTIPLAVHITKR